ncbi:L-ascorbate 6-phosphate lactonase [Halopenitus malekzadehii]|uniref:L-ascorbate 6-phosphate lactonase n=1 Tax=Halopenitus malekzadehii TaxID=1267564 RepID=A0A1H6I1L0_9EURY|nr:MBL fold metallo-hydrolase [Halopenitus malekzadehii]SEH41941.1 L-ascorbate 6-phosphate lactonase [Halopenitus malekzadehii]
MAVHSDWGDWLPQAIADSDPEGVAVWYLGCNGFVLRDGEGTTIFIDPYLGTGDPPRTIRMIPVPFDPTDVEHADAILATHEHVDHVHGPSQAPILERTDATFYGPDDAVAVAREEEAWPETYDVAAEQLVSVVEGDAIEIDAFTVHVEPATDPDASHPVTYVIDHPAGTMFHGGDSKPDPEFADIGSRYDIDLGVLAVGTVGMIPDRETRVPSVTKWYNDENQCLEAARDLQLDRLLPSHWDMWKRLTADPASLHQHARGFEYPRRLEIVEIGDRIRL